MKYCAALILASFPFVSAFVASHLAYAEETVPYESGQTLECRLSDYVVPSGHPDGVDVKGKATIANHRPDAKNHPELAESWLIAEVDTRSQVPGKYGVVFVASFRTFDFLNPGRPKLTISLYRKKNGKVAEYPIVTLVAPAPEPSEGFPTPSDYHGQSTRLAAEVSPGVTVDAHCWIRPRGKY